MYQAEQKMIICYDNNKNNIKRKIREHDTNLFD